MAEMDQSGFYSFSHPVDGAKGIVFSARLCMHAARLRHFLTGLPLSSSFECEACHGEWLLCTRLSLEWRSVCVKET